MSKERAPVELAQPTFHGSISRAQLIRNAKFCSDAFTDALNVTHIFQINRETLKSSGSGHEVTLFRTSRVFCYIVRASYSRFVFGTQTVCQKNYDVIICMGENILIRTDKFEDWNGAVTRRVERMYLFLRATVQLFVLCLYSIDRGA